MNNSLDRKPIIKAWFVVGLVIVIGSIAAWWATLHNLGATNTSATNSHPLQSLYYTWDGQRLESDAYTTDGTSIFFMQGPTEADKIKMNVDFATFEVVYGGLQVNEFAKDKNYAYYGNLPLIGVDAATFAIGGGSLDPNYDPSQWKEFYFKDKNHVYLLNRYFEGQGETDASEANGAFQIVK